MNGPSSPSEVPQPSSDAKSGLFDGHAPFADRTPPTGDRRTQGRRTDAPESSGLDRRRGPGRRLSDFTRAAEEGELTKEQFMFLMAIEAFKRANSVTFPAWTDVLEVVRLLGYRKTRSAEISLPNAEDWTELPTTPSNVRPERWHLRRAA
ncbi:MAG: hypothetical protein ACOYN0_03715 [Phycisphaerales bacterium]